MSGRGALGPPRHVTLPSSVASPVQWGWWRQLPSGVVRVPGTRCVNELQWLGVAARAVGANPPWPVRALTTPCPPPRAPWY